MAAPLYDPHSEPHYDVTTPQLTLAIVWLTSLILWLIRRVSNQGDKIQLITNSHDINLTTSCRDRIIYAVTVCTDVITRREVLKQADSEADNSGMHIDNAGLSNRLANNSSIEIQPEGTSQHKADCKITSTEPATVSLDDCLRNIILLGVLMIYVYLCDYIKIFPASKRVYDRDELIFLVLVLLAVGCFFTTKTTADKTLNRDQTDEWKGWMQVLFVWYHYFLAKELYNWIRVFIACYVWMTGFGNFSFFWIRKDYSLWRFCKMLFRINFSVIVLCCVVSNAYIVYYICAMHTYWFLSVYVTMAICSSFNNHRLVMASKLAVYAVFNSMVFDLPGAGRLIFQPLTFVLGLRSANETVIVESGSDLHEWLFRAGLDHWSCLFGMLCAYNYPYWEWLICHLEADTRRVPFIGFRVANVIKSAISIVLIVVSVVWYFEFAAIPDKIAYNRLHPLTSHIPLIVYVIMRNLWPTLRTRYIGLFSWLGKMTLETYLCQLHIYLQTNAHQIIVYLDHSQYPRLNFSLATVIYLFVSLRLFHITNTLSSFFLPLKLDLVYRRCGRASIVILIAVVTSLTLNYRLQFSLVPTV